MQSNDQTLKEAIEEMLKAYRIDNKCNEMRISDVWEKLMGKGIAKYTKSITLRNKKLYITLSSSPLKTELHYAKAGIIQSLNREFGKEMVKDIYIK